MYNFILSFFRSFFSYFAFSEERRNDAGQLVAWLATCIVAWEVLPGWEIPLSVILCLTARRYIDIWEFQMGHMVAGFGVLLMFLTAPVKTTQETIPEARFDFVDYLLSKQELMEHYRNSPNVTYGLHRGKELTAEIMDHPIRKYLLENPAVCVLHVANLSWLDFAVDKTNALLLSVPQAFYSNRRFTCRIAIVFGHGDSQGGVHGHLTHALDKEETRLEEEEIKLAYPQLEILFVKCRGNESYASFPSLYAQNGAWFVAKPGQATHGEWLFRAWRYQPLREFFDLYRH